ncbi:hypothetical protein [Kitasatospora sp. McL0602]|uniref:hypothetical protein n=1 Tax=Kitasatospora sp. McL0602 TaxID=3439530 RepID=UPI003F8BDC78
MTSQRSLSTVAVSLLLALTTAACGGTEKHAAADPSASAPATATATPALTELSGEEILKQAQQAMAQASSFREVGEVADGDGNAALDLAADRQGNCVGTVRERKAGGFEVRHSATQTWIKPDAVGWQALIVKQGASAEVATAVAGRVEGRYLTAGPGDSGLEGMTELCRTMSDIPKGLAGATKVVKGPVQVTEGVLSISLTVTDADGSSSQVYVAATGKPYLTKLEDQASTVPTQIVFRDFDKPVTVEAPAADQVLDTKALGKQLG